MKIILQSSLRYAPTSVQAFSSLCRRHGVLRAESFARGHPVRLSSTVSATRINHNTAINPPSSTLPPPLVLPVRAPDQSAPGYYFSLGKAYLAFYKTGAKAVYSNWQAARAISARLPPATPIGDALQRGLLSRAEWQLMHRSRQDIKKVPLFAVVFMICGEFTPLVVVFMSGVVPRTCKVPKQVQGDREKVERRRESSFRDGTLGAVGDVPEATVAMEGLKPEQVAHIGRSLGLYPAVADRFGGFPTGLLWRSVKKWKDYVDLDDAAVERSGGVGQMEMEEVKIALEERGLDILGRNDTQLRNSLRSWLRARKQEPVTKLLLMRPSVWAKQYQ